MHEPQGFMTPSAASLEAHALKCELAADAFRSSGYLRLQVTGWSMLPAVRPGDVVILKGARPEEISKGDIVLLLRNRRLVVHRVVEIDGGTGLVTRGDSMPLADPPAASHECLGKVVSILRDGQAIQPRRSLSATQRFFAALVGRSTVAARIFVRIDRLFRSAFASTTPSNRVVSCQS
jgi:signal peptidase I